MSEWKSTETAPKDGKTWVLLRGRNSAGYPMVPVVACWFAPGSKHQGWSDSGTLKPVDDLAVEWMPLPDWEADPTP